MRRNLCGCVSSISRKERRSESEHASRARPRAESHPVLVYRDLDAERRRAPNSRSARPNGRQFRGEPGLPTHRLTDATEFVDVNFVAGTALEDTNQL